MNRWDKYALLVLISKLMNKKEYKLGKTSLQKLIYLLKSVYKLPIRYSYDFYIYGPYSSELSGDLEYLDSIQVLNVSFENYGDYRGFNITPNKKSDKIIEKANIFINKNKDKIEEIIDIYGNKTARELELIATIIYLVKEENIHQDLLAKRIKELKPHFEENEITRKIEEVNSILLEIQ